MDTKSPKQSRRQRILGYWIGSILLTLFLIYNISEETGYLDFRVIKYRNLSNQIEEQPLNVETNEISEDWLVYDLGFVGMGDVFLNWFAEDQLWVSAEGRLIRFDGQNWIDSKSEILELWEEDIIRNKWGNLYILGLGVSSDRIYAGFKNSGAGIYDIANQVWNMYDDRKSLLSGGSVEGTIAVDEQGRGYLPTDAHFLDIYDDGKWERIQLPYVIHPKRDYHCHYASGLFDQEGNYWLASCSSILKFDGEEWSTTPTFFPINSFAIDSKGRIWAATRDGLVVGDVDGSWYHYTPENSPLEEDYIIGIAIDSLDRVWVTNEFQVLVFNGQDWQVFPPDLIGATKWEGGIAIDEDDQPWLSVLIKPGIAVFRGEVEIGPFIELVDPPLPAEEFLMPELEFPQITIWEKITGVVGMIWDVGGMFIMTLIIIFYISRRNLKLEQMNNEDGDPHEKTP